MKEKILKINQRICQLKSEIAQAKEDLDFDTCSYLRAQIYGLEQAINILEE